MLVRLYPPYSTIVGKREVQVPLGEPVTLMEAFRGLADAYPALREHFYPVAGEEDFPGYTRILRDGKPLYPGDLVGPDDVVEVVVALMGG